MKNFGAKWLALAAGTGGSAVAGKGGSTSTAGTGGSVSTAGTGGSAGGGTGGAGGTGGSTGTGGAAGGLPCPGFGTFDTSDMQGFGLNTYMGTTAGSAVNLAVTEAGTQATIGWDSADGSPSPGSLKVTAPFSDYNQFVDVQHGFGSTMLKDWHAYKLHVRVKVETTNYPTTNPLGVQVYVNTGSSYQGYCQTYTNVKSNGNWDDYVLDLSQSTCTTTPQDPTMVIAAGVSFQTGSGSNGDGGTTSMKPTAATIHVDSFWLEGSCSTGGTGGGGAGGTAGSTGGTAGGTGGTAGGTGGTAGGTGGTAGTSGTGGGTDGGTAASVPYYTFDTSAQGWALGTSGTGNIAAIEGGTPPSFGWDSTVSSPAGGGSLKVSGTFTNYGQLLQVNSGAIGPMLDLTGKTVHLWVRLDSGGAGTGFSGGMQVQFFSGSGFTFGQNNSVYVSLTAGTWTEVTVDMAAVKTMYSTFDPGSVVQIQLQFLTGTQPEGGTFTTTTPTFHIDTITDGSGGGAPPLFNTTFDHSLQGWAASMTTPDGS